MIVNMGEYGKKPDRGHEAGCFSRGFGILISQGNGTTLCRVSPVTEHVCPDLN